MSNNSSDNNSKQSPDNKAVVGVEVVKDDTVVYEDGDFEEYNEAHNYEDDTDDKSSENNKVAKDDKSNKESEKESNKDSQSDKGAKSDKDQKSDKKDDSADNKSDKKEESNKNDNADKKDKSDKEENADKKDQSEQDDSSNMTMAGMFQWASKLREDFMSEAMNMTSGVTEKATVMTLQRLIAVVDMELSAFDKSVEVAKNLIANVEAEREKIVARKEKYQDMIDNLDQDE